MKKFNQKGFVGALGIVAIATVAILIGFVVYRFTGDAGRSDNQQPNTEETEEKQEISETDGPQDETETNESAKQSGENDQVLSMTLNFKKIQIDVSDSQYDDIVAQFRKGDDNRRTIYAVYSQDLLKRVNQSNGLEPTDTYGCNNVVEVYSWDDESEGAHSTNIGTVNGRYVHAGFSGPCEPSEDPELLNEMIEFRDYIVEKIRMQVN